MWQLSTAPTPGLSLAACTGGNGAVLVAFSTHPRTSMGEVLVAVGFRV